MKKFKPTQEFMEGSTRLLRVPLNKTGDVAVLTAKDHNELRDMNVGNLRIHASGHVIASSSAFNSGYCLIGRLLLGAKNGESVVYLDGNKLNLRRNNMKLRWNPRTDLQNTREIYLSHTTG